MYLFRAPVWLFFELKLGFSKDLAESELMALPLSLHLRRPLFSESDLRPGRGSWAESKLFDQHGRNQQGWCEGMFPPPLCRCYHMLHGPSLPLSVWPTRRSLPEQIVRYLVFSFSVVCCCYQGERNTVLANLTYFEYPGIFTDGGYIRIYKQISHAWQFLVIEFKKRPLTLIL